ncbi:Ig-like domain-containing protein [Paenibacillus terrigena]|uniref:Ig-like domain-containing protein n=1 Tax=Paenibacillus terrigena TaxID=369333 RepID=UPI000364C00A|nr:Ig-like domain-containing protein [Paenibacillus terrigena]
MRKKVSLWLACVMVIQLVIGLLPVSAAGSQGKAGSKSAVKVASVTNAVYSAPQILNTIPAHNASEVSVNTRLDIVFDQPVTKGSGYITIVDQSASSEYQKIDVNTSEVSISGKFVSISNKALVANKRYYVTIDPGAIKNTTDGGDLPFAGLSGTSWSFNTVRLVDTTAPVVTSYYPTNGTNVSSASSLTLTFNEVVYPGSGNIRIFNASNQPVDTISANSLQVTGGGTTVIRINPTSGALNSNTSYYVLIDAGAFTDQAYNPYAGISSSSTWTFRVATDTTKPYVISQSPSDGSSNVAIGATISLTFSEDVQLNTSTISLRPINTNANTITGRTSLSSDRRTVTIIPQSSMGFSTTYAIDIPSDFVRDLAGNPNDARWGTSYWTFTTTIQDNTAPVLQSIKMYNNNAIVLQYNEYLDQNSEPYTSNFTVSINDESRGVSSVSVSGDRVYVYLQSGVAVGQYVKVTYSPGVRPIQDLARNKASSFYNQVVQNTVETTLPKVTSGYISGRTLSLTFSDSINNLSSYAYTQFTVTANGSTKSISSNSTYNSSSITLTLDSSVSNGEVIKVSYSPGSYPLMSYYGTPISSFSDFFIRNYNDNVAPKLESTSVNGNKLVLTYNEAIDSSFVPMKSHYSVLVNDKPIYVTAISINQNIVELTLASSVATNQTVTVSYAPGDPRLRDLNGNYAPAFNLEKVGYGNNTGIPYVKSAVLNGDIITLTMSEKVSTASTLGSSQFSVRANNAAVTVNAVTLNTYNDTITIRLGSTIPSSGQSVIVSYTPGYYPIKDLDGNELKAFTNMAVTGPSGTTGVTGSDLLKSEQGYNPYASTLNILKSDVAQISSDRSRSGQPINRYTLDGAKLKEAFLYVIKQDPSLNKVVTFDVSTTERAAAVAIPVQTLEEIRSQNMNTYLSIRFGEATYTLPLKSMDVGQLTRGLGSSGNNVLILMQIEKQSSGNSAIPIVSQINKGSIQPVSEPYDFHISGIIANSSSQQSQDMNIRMDHMLKLRTVAKEDQSAAIRYDSVAGQISYVPTLFGKDTSATYATFTGPSNDMYRIVSNNAYYADVQTHWAKADITQLASKFVVEGRSSTAFVPNASITRAEFAVFVARALGLSGDKASAARFKDVSSNTMEGAYIGAASKAGIIQGNTDGTFKPNNLITREQMALMVVRAMDHVGKGVVLDTDSSTLLKKFSDRGKINKSAQIAVAKALQSEIIAGMTANTFNPQGNATRAQAVVMLKRMMQSIQYLN